jgi:hypothetical protein
VAMKAFVTPLFVALVPFGEGDRDLRSFGRPGGGEGGVSLGTEGLLEGHPITPTCTCMHSV